MKKYELIKTDSIQHCGVTLYRIKALIDFSHVKAGQVGGYVENEENLSQEGNAWVYDNAHVYGKARVYGNACVYDDACVYGNACVYDDACVCGEARISGNDDIKNETDYILFKNNWSSGRFFTYTKSNKMWRVGCFHGTGDELVKKAYEDSQLSGDHYKLYVELVEKMEEIENG